MEKETNKYGNCMNACSMCTFCLFHVQTHKITGKLRTMGEGMGTVKIQALTYFWTSGHRGVVGGSYGYIHITSPRDQALISLIRLKHSI